ncbi:hypothetical protein CR513_37562, partial [Mucuna pruriens]
MHILDGSHQMYTMYIAFVTLQAISTIDLRMYNVGLMTYQKKNGVLCMMMKCREYFVQRGAEVISELGCGQMYCKKLMDAIKKIKYNIQSTTIEVVETFNPITQRGEQTWTVVLNT